MITRHTWISALALGALVGFAGGVSAQGLAETEAYKISQGGKLYDNWAKTLDVGTPEGTHPAYPSEGTQEGKGTFRCKECHGWDYSGADGAYASGSHFSGVGGIRGFDGGDPADVAAIVRDGTHGFTADMIPDGALENLALFVVKGQVDMDQYIDRASKAPQGDGARGAVLYQTVCAGCHGLDGLKPKDMKPFGAQMGNPWEVMHKILNGQPDEAMPSLRALDRQDVVDIMVHLTTLPTER